MMALLLQIGPWLAGLVGIVAGIFMRQQAKATKAQAAQEVAETKQKVAEQSAAAAQAGADSAKERIHVENEIAARPSGDAAQRLRDRWSAD